MKRPAPIASGSAQNKRWWAPGSASQKPPAVSHQQHAALARRGSMINSTAGMPAAAHTPTRTGSSSQPRGVRGAPAQRRRQCRHRHPDHRGHPCGNTARRPTWRMTQIAQQRLAPGKPSITAQPASPPATAAPARFPRMGGSSMNGVACQGSFNRRLQRSSTALAKRQGRRGEQQRSGHKAISTSAPRASGYKPAAPNGLNGRWPPSAPTDGRQRAQPCARSIQHQIEIEGDTPRQVDL